MKKFFDALKTVYGPQSSGTTPLLSAEGTSLLTDKEAILERWAEHFDGVLNRPSSISDEAINRLGKGILKSVTIIEASLYCQLLGRSLLGSYLTD